VRVDIRRQLNVIVGLNLKEEPLNHILSDLVDVTLSPRIVERRAMCDCRIAAQLVTAFVCFTVVGGTRERGFSPDSYSKSYHGNRGDTTV